MSRKKISIILLCEEVQHESFFRKLLSKKGYSFKKIRTKIAPKGVGSGEQYVRTVYPQQVKILRSKPHITSKALLVVIDVDSETVEARHKQLDESLDKKRESHENIFIATPKWNIETWIHYLDGTPVSEDKAYSKLTEKAKSCKKSAEKLAEAIHCLPNDAPDSLKKSAKEINRIFT